MAPSLTTGDRWSVFNRSATGVHDRMSAGTYNIGCGRAVAFRVAAAPSHRTVSWLSGYEGFMTTLINSIGGEYRRYKTLAEAALDQVADARLSEAGPANGNSLAVMCWHVSGNLRSRFTDFLTTDGEKP